MISKEEALRTKLLAIIEQSEVPEIVTVRENYTEFIRDLEEEVLSKYLHYHKDWFWVGEGGQGKVQLDRILIPFLLELERKITR